MKLKGKRVPLVHDISSLVTSKRYNDSLIIPLKEYQNSINYKIEGIDIDVPEGNYLYKGDIKIIRDKIIVNLLIDNYSEKKLIPEIWNGEYNLILKK